MENLEPKYRLEDLTTDEQKNYMARFDALNQEMGTYFEAVPQFSRDDLQSPWKVVCMVLLKKKVLIEDKKEEGIPSPFTPNESDSTTS